MLKNKLETNRWLKCLEIAGVLFWHEGYHTKYLSGIENFIRRKQMYSPKISEELIPKLYQLSKVKKITMTNLVNGIIEQHIKRNMERRQDHKGKAVVSGSG